MRDWVARINTYFFMTDTADQTMHADVAASYTTGSLKARILVERCNPTNVTVFESWPALEN